MKRCAHLAHPFTTCRLSGESCGYRLGKVKETEIVEVHGQERERITDTTAFEGCPHAQASGIDAANEGGEA